MSSLQASPQTELPRGSLAPDNSSIAGKAVVDLEEGVVILRFPGTDPECFAFVAGSPLDMVFDAGVELRSERGRLRGVLQVPDVLKQGRLLTMNGKQYQVEVLRLQIRSPVSDGSQSSSSSSPLSTPTLVRKLSSISVGSASPTSSSSPPSTPTAVRRLSVAGTRVGTRDYVDPSVNFTSYPEMLRDHPLLDTRVDPTTNRTSEQRLRFRVNSMPLIGTCARVCVCVCVCP